MVVWIFGYIRLLWVTIQIYPLINFLIPSLSLIMENTLQQISTMKQSLLDEGFVDRHFIELELFQVGDNPQFFEEMVNLFFVDSARLIVNMEDELKHDLIDHSKVDSILHQFKGSSSSIGASRVAVQVAKLQEICNDGDIDDSNEALRQLKNELATLKEKVDTYVQLLKQLGSEKKSQQHPGEGQVDELADNQLTKLAITEGGKEDSGHEEDSEKKVPDEETEKVETEEEAANIEDNGESVKAERVETEEAAANIEDNGESVKAEPEMVETEEEAANIVNKGESVKAVAD